MTDGYVSDVAYPAFFYKEMQPVWLATVAGLRGFSAPDPAAPFTLCEWGCGVGINLLVAAACHPQAHFVGVDFNAEHLRIARAAAQASGLANVEFVDAEFAAFARDDRRQFDFITCHGVWSWIAAEHRAVLSDHAARSLKSGGLLYLHYMCHPGSTDLAPLQQLMKLCAGQMAGSSAQKAGMGLKLAQRLVDGGAFADSPAMRRHLANMGTRDPADLAHEFLTDHWLPQHSVDVHRDMAAAGLALIGSADVFANLDVSLSIPGNLQDLVRQTRIPALAETLKDIARNTHQRMDLFQKDPASLDGNAFLARFGAISFEAMPGAPLRGSVTFATPIGPVTGPEALFTPLLERLATGPASGADLLQLPAFAGDAGGLLQALQLLMMQGLAHPSGPPCPGVQDRARDLSRWFRGNGVALTVVDACATAIAGGGAG